MSDYKIGPYTATEEPCEAGPCWHIRGPGIHSVVECRDEALWAVGVCDVAFAAGQRAADAELVGACEELIRLIDLDHGEPVEMSRCRFDDIRAALAKHGAKP